MNKSIISTITAAAILASASTVAFAASGDDNGKRGGKRGGPNIERMLEKLDTNKDGGITLEEVKAHQGTIFASVDANSDSSLTQEEFNMIKEMRKAEREAKKAENGEQTTETAQSDDKDGKKRKGKRGGKRGEMRGMGFERLDADNSGAVSLEEFTAHADKMFDRMDRNDDGVINTDDVKRKRS
jgi:Ca2+-binding EF-hand superfamily protein